MLHPGYVTRIDRTTPTNMPGFESEQCEDHWSCDEESDNEQGKDIVIKTENDFKSFYSEHE